MTDPKFTRRRMLGASVVAAVGLTTITESQARASLPLNGKPAISGTIERVGDQYIDMLTGNDHVRVTFSKNARFHRDTTDVTLSGFVVGDLVVAELVARPELHTSNYLETLYRVIEGDIIRLDGNRLDITQGVSWLDSRTTIHGPDDRNPLPRSVLTPGTEVGVTCFYDPSKRRLVARDIGLEA